MSIHGPLVMVGHDSLGVIDNCGDLPLLSVDNARSTLSCLDPTGCAAPAAPKSRSLGRDSNQASGHCSEHLAVRQKLGGCAPKEARATTAGVPSQCLPLWCPLSLLGLQVVLVQGFPVVVGHTHLWSE